MKPLAKKTATAKDFPGRISNADSGDIPFGAAVEQDNLQAIIPGKLTVRKGWRRAENYNREDVGEVVRSDLTNIYRYPHASGDIIITVNEDGDIQARRDNGVTVIRSDEFGDTHWTFARDRAGALIGINGFGRGIYWDGTVVAAEELGLDAPAAAPTVVLSAAGGSVFTAGDYICYYRYVAGPVGKYHYSNLSAAGTVTANGTTHSKITWSALSSPTQDRVHTVELWRSLPGDENTLYLVGTINSNFQRMTFSNSGGFLKVTTVRLHGLTTSMSIVISGSGGDDGTHNITSVVDDYSFITDQPWSTVPAGAGALILAGGFVDTLSDATLQDNALADPDTILLITSNNELVANRFVPPPTWKCSMAKFQDRMFYAADAVLDDGSLTTTADNKQIYINDRPIAALWLFDGRTVYMRDYEVGMSIINVVDSTRFEVDPPPTQSQVQQTGYAIRPPDGERNVLYYSEPDEPQSVPRTNILTIQDQTEDEDDIVGIHTFGPYLYILKQHHIYTMSYVRQPRIDAQSRLLCHRGAYNKNCWSTHEGVAYLMDSSGCYVLGMNGAFESISEPIQDMWRDGTIDITDTQWFFCKVDTKYSIVKFYVRFTGDYGNRPRRALCYNIRTGAWWTESYPMQIADAITIDVEGDRFNLGAGQNDIVIDLARGESDMVEGETRGVVEAATAETIADSGVFFDESHVGAPIAILDGNGRGQVRTILEIVSDHVVTISAGGGEIIDFDQGPLDPVPDVGSLYLIGGINYRYRTGSYDLVVDEDQNRRGVVIEYTPTEDEYHIWLRRYWDNESDPDNNFVGQDLGNGMFTIMNEPEVWISTKRYLSPRGIRSGRSEFLYSGKTEQFSQGHWSVSIEIEGIKGDEILEINTVEMVGVDP